ncbi:MAG: hypothetical protein ABIK65_15665 [Candidatus Eisenbacteria bacterium]
MTNTIRSGAALLLFLVFLLAGCAGRSTTGGILTNNLTKESAVAAVAKVLSEGGYTVTEASELTGTVETDWLPDPASAIPGFATRYTATVTDEQVSLHKLARGMVDDKMTPLKSGGVDLPILEKLAGLLGTTVDAGVQKSNRQQQTEDPGDGP